MDKIKLLQGDKITFELDGEDLTVESWSDLAIETNSLIVINNTMCCTGAITKLNEKHYKVHCFYQEALIVQGEYYYGKQSELN
jgi:hypothetical protein